jgi:hypothetical protein
MNNMKEIFDSYPKEKQEQIKAAFAKLLNKPAPPPAQPQQPTGNQS